MVVDISIITKKSGAARPAASHMGGFPVFCRVDQCHDGSCAPVDVFVGDATEYQLGGTVLVQIYEAISHGVQRIVSLTGIME